VHAFVASRAVTAAHARADASAQTRQFCKGGPKRGSKDFQCLPMALFAARHYTSPRASAEPGLGQLQESLRRIYLPTDQHLQVNFWTISWIECRYQITIKQKVPQNLRLKFD
jgi:hypothetical protein